MYVEHFKLAYLELKLKITPSKLTLIEDYEKMKRSLNSHIKLELGLESVFQLAGQLILLLMAYTETATQSGLKTFFKSSEADEKVTQFFHLILNEEEGQDEWTQLLLVIWNQFFLVASIVLSFQSCISSHWKALTACREHFPCKSRIVSGLFCLFGCVTRVTAIVMFFTGPLGLFSLLIHLQGEQYPWSKYVLDLVNPHDGTMVLGNNPPFKWTRVDRWEKNGSLYLEYDNGTLMEKHGNLVPNPSYLVSPPNYTLYVGISLRFYLLIFLASIGVQMLVIFIAKSFLSKAFSSAFNILEKLIHCLENTNIPFNAKEWDDDKGDAEEHRKRMRANWLEVLSVIIINGIFNLLLLTPLFYLGKYKISSQALECFKRLK